MSREDLPEVYWTHYAHLQDIAVSPNTEVDAGNKIGTVGATGSVTTAHLHFEIVLQFRSYTAYTLGNDGNPFSQEEMAEHYMDPGIYLQYQGVVVPMKYTHLGYEWLSVIGTVNGQSQYHSGYDMNRGSGNDDIGDPIYAAESGRVVYTGNDGGWGNHVWIEHTTKQQQIDSMLEEEGRELVYYKENDDSEAQYFVLNNSQNPRTRRKVKRNHEAWVRGALFSKQRQLKSLSEIDSYQDEGDFKPNNLIRSKPYLFD